MDISQIERLPEQGYGQFDLCFHLAWIHTGDKGRDNPLLQSQNIQDTLKTAQAAKEMDCQVFVGAGYQAEYGIVNKKADENDMRCNWVRIFAVYGSYENDYILPAYVMHMLLEGRKPILTSCEQLWNYLYCENAACALLQVGERALESGIIHMDSNCPMNMRQYVEEYCYLIYG